MPPSLETCTQKNISVYQRKGFAVFHENALDAARGTTAYLMRRTGPQAQLQATLAPATHTAAQ
ncbi:MAG: hypothetical protein AAGN35_25140 [Bacteroidota bacterium]